MIMIYKITGMMIPTNNLLSSSIEFRKIKIISKLNKKENQIIIVLLIEDQFKIRWHNKM